jgi:ketosteroid isomerase-like protein
VGDPRGVMDRLTAAQNEHDLEAMLACFHEDYRSEQPLFPSRTFEGIDQVRANWSALLEAIPDFRGEVLRSAVDGDTVFIEIHWTGTKADGSPLDERGVIIAGIRDDRIAWGLSMSTKSSTRAPTSTRRSAVWREPEILSGSPSPGRCAVGSNGVRRCAQVTAAFAGCVARHRRDWSPRRLSRMAKERRPTRDCRFSREALAEGRFVVRGSDVQRQKGGAYG